MNKNQITYLLILILLLGAFLRFYNISGESFWLDEGTTALTIKKHSASEIIQNVKEKGQILPTYYSYGKYQYDEDLPAYYVLLRGWINIFGMDEFSFRAFSAVLSTLALIAIFYLTRYLFDSKTALLATFLSSINLTLIWYSQEARQYSYLLFLSILSVIFLLKTLKEGKTRYLILLILINSFIIFPGNLYVRNCSAFFYYVILNCFHLIFGLMLFIKFCEKERFFE